MNAKDILKEAFDSDIKVLEQALEQDKKLADMSAEWITGVIIKLGRLLDVLVKHDLITIDEATSILKSDNENKLEEDK